MGKNRRRRPEPQRPSASKARLSAGWQPKSPYERISLVDEGFRRLLSVCSPHKAAGRLHTACCEEDDCDLWCDGKLQDRNYIKHLTFEARPTADGRWRLKITKGVDAINTDGSRSFVFDESARNWEVSVAGIAALKAELSSKRREQIALASAPTVKVKLPDKIKVQLVEKPASATPKPTPSSSPSSSPPSSSTPQRTDAQIEMWINDLSIPPTWREIRRFVAKEYGGDWRGISTPTIVKAAKENPEFRRRAHPIPSAVTWNRALERKRDRKKG